MELTGKVHFIYDESSNLITLTFSEPGETPEEHDAMAAETSQFYNDLVKRRPEERFRVLVNLSRAGMPTKRATELYIETFSDKRIEKTAFLGMSSSIKAIINFIVKAAGKGENVRFFIDEVEALAWLKAA